MNIDSFRFKFNKNPILSSLICYGVDEDDNIDDVVDALVYSAPYLSKR